MTATTTPKLSNPGILPQTWVDELQARFSKIEKYLEIDTRYQGQGIPTRLSNVEQGVQAGGGVSTSELPAPVNFSETLSASGAASLSCPITILDGTTNASAITLAAPTGDMQPKLIYLGVSAAHHPTLAGTNILGQSGKNGTFANLGDWIMLCSVRQKWVVMATNITFA